MKLPALFFFGFFLLCMASISCKRKVEEFKTDALSDYYPLQPGKYLTYRVDSTVFYPLLGRGEEIHSYQEKLVVDSPITDNAGRSGYRVFRYLRDTAGINSWRSAGSLSVIPLRNQVEVVEDNQRVIRLILPLKKDQTWNGYSYVASNAFESQYDFNDDNHLNTNSWKLRYGNFGETVTLNGKPYTDVLTVNGPDESTNVPITDQNSFASRTYLVEKYAKNIGLVYQELQMWEYQPNPNPNSTAFRVGFGLKKFLIDHN